MAPRPGKTAFFFDSRERLTREDLWAWEEASRHLEATSSASGHTGGLEGTGETARNVAVIAAMRDPGFYGHPPDEVEVRETPGSCVFLTGDRAYKVRKAIVLPFLDYRSVARRRHLANEEVRLNRRLAEDLYLGVKGIAPIDGGLQLVGPDDPRAVEYAVEMRRFPERETLACAVREGRADSSTLAAVGQRLAAFHAGAEVRYHAGGEAAHLKRYLGETFATLASGAAMLGHRRLLEAERFAASFVAARSATLDARATAGLVRDGHGDLRCEHVLIGDDDKPRLRVFDCIEFDSGLRELDVGADLSFLVMDLESEGRPELARHLVAGYRRGGGDPGDGQLIAFHAASRAWVRAKVAWLRSEKPRATSRARAEDLAEADRLLKLAERLSWRARLPLVIMVCGLPASGKSRLSRALGERCGLPVLSSDRIRKELAGLAPDQRADASRYTAAASLETYRELGRRTAAEVSTGDGAIVDATFRHWSDRESFSDELEAGAAPVLAIECRAPASVLRARARARDRADSCASDADAAVVEGLIGDWEPLDEAAPGSHLIVRTDRNVDHVLDDVIAVLDCRLCSGGKATVGGAERP